MEETVRTLAEYMRVHGLLKDFPLRVLDVGAREGESGVLSGLYGFSEVIGFDFDAEECRRLNRSFQEKGYRYFPVVLAGEDGRRGFHITKFPHSSGLYAARRDFFNRFAAVHSDNTRVIDIIEVETRRMDTFLESERLEPPDFIKLDVEGAELEVLSGAGKALGDCLGVMVEVLFQDACGQPHFADVDIFLRKRGFRFYSFLHLGKYPRRCLPDPRCWKDGVEVAWLEDKGQTLRGDALYFVDPIEAPDKFRERPGSLLKLAVLMEAFGYNDCAIELIQEMRAEVSRWMDPEIAIDLLTPEIFGRKAAYRDYIAQAKMGGAEPVPHSIFCWDPPLNEQFVSWIHDHSRVIVYPAGRHAAWLMENTLLPHVNIIGFSDGNAALHETRFFGIPVIPPDQIVSLQPDVVLIASHLHEGSIREELLRLDPEYLRNRMFAVGPAPVT